MGQHEVQQVGQQVGEGVAVEQQEGVGEMGVEEAIARVMQAWENSPGTSPDDKGSEKDKDMDKDNNKINVENKGSDKDQTTAGGGGELGDVPSDDVKMMGQVGNTPTDTPIDSPTGGSNTGTATGTTAPTTTTVPTPRSRPGHSPVKRPVATPLPPPPARTPTRVVEAIDVADTPMAHASVVGR